MQLLPNGLYRIKNTQTGESRDITPDQLPQYGLSPQPQQAPASPTQPSPAIQAATQNSQAATAPDTDAIKAQVIQQLRDSGQLKDPVNNVDKNSVGVIENAIGNTGAYDIPVLGGIARALTHPFIKAGELAGQAGSEALTAATGGTQAPQIASNDAMKDIGDSKERSVLGTLTQGGRDAAGVGAFAVPFGQAGVVGSQFVLPGIATGVLNAVSQDNATPGSVAKGAAVGGLVGGGVQALGAIGNKIAGGLAGNGVQGDITNPIANAKGNVNYANDVQDLKDVADKYLGTGSAADKLAKLPEAASNLDTTIQTLQASGSGDQTQLAELIKDRGLLDGLSPGLAKSANKAGPSIPLPFTLGAKIPLPISRSAFQGAQSALGNAASNVGEALQNVPAALPGIAAQGAIRGVQGLPSILSGQDSTGNTQAPVGSPLAKIQTIDDVQPQGKASLPAITTSPTTQYLSGHSPEQIYGAYQKATQAALAGDKGAAKAAVALKQTYDDETSYQAEQAKNAKNSQDSRQINSHVQTASDYLDEIKGQLFNLDGSINRGAIADDATLGRSPYASTMNGLIMQIIQSQTPTGRIPTAEQREEAEKTYRPKVSDPDITIIKKLNNAVTALNNARYTKATASDISADEAAP